MNLCCDCKHGWHMEVVSNTEGVLSDVWECQRFKVEGDMSRYPDVSWERSSGECGREGKFWEKK